MFYKSKIDELNDKKAEEEKRQTKEIENLKLACKEIFKDDNGIYFIKFLKKISGWNDQDNNINNDVLAYRKGRRDIYNIIRNVIPKDILIKVEIYD